MSKDNKRAIQLFRKFLKDCSKIFLSKMQNIEFKETKISSRPFQNDANNCDIYILYYLKCIAEERFWYITRAYITSKQNCRNLTSHVFNYERYMFVLFI